MSNLVQQDQQRGLEPARAFDLSPRTLDEAIRFADMLANSDIVPKDFQKKPGNVLVAIQWGMEIGLKPMQAMQNIAVINGRPSLWGDAVLALVRASPHCEYVTETHEGDTAICRAKRRGAPAEHVVKFSQADALKAGLSGKAGPWSQFPARMRQMRARAFALRDTFPDVLKGIPIAEEVMDLPPVTNGMPPEYAAIGKEAADDPNAKRRAELIASLEAVAANGMKSLGDAWKAIADADRHLVGPKEWERIKALAPKKSKPDEPPAVDAVKPTYAQIMQSINESADAAALAEALGVDMAHLTPQMQGELIDAGKAKAAAMGAEA